MFIYFYVLFIYTKQVMKINQVIENKEVIKDSKVYKQSKKKNGKISSNKEAMVFFSQTKHMNTSDTRSLFLSLSLI